MNHVVLNIDSARQNKDQLGMALLEVLVSLVLVAVIALTASASSLRAQQTQQQALETTLVALAADDLLERVRSNPAEAAEYVFDSSETENCPAADTSLASVDLSDWCSRLHQLLPSPRFDFTFDPLEQKADLKISWLSRTGDGYLVKQTDQEPARVEVEWKEVSLRMRHE